MGHTPTLLGKGERQPLAEITVALDYFSSGLYKAPAESPHDSQDAVAASPTWSGMEVVAPGQTLFGDQSCHTFVLVKLFQLRT